MRKTLFLLASVVVITLSLVPVIAGCNGKVELNVDKVRQYADPITEEMLQAANSGDYISYCSFFDDTMKAAMTEYLFSTTNTMIKSTIGDYVSKEFWKVETEGDALVVYYKADYTLEPADVDVKVVFREIEGEMYVSGIWFESPMLIE
jgi:hypothetical protein